MPPAASDDGPDWMFIGGIASAVVGVGNFVLLGVAVGEVSSLQDDPGFTAYRAGLTASQSACDEAEAGTSVNVAGAASPEQVAVICSDADGYQSLQIASGILGGAMLGLGGYLIITSDTVSSPASDERYNAKPTIHFVPYVGPNGAHGTLTASF